MIRRVETTLDWLGNRLGSLTKEHRTQIREWNLVLSDAQPRWFAQQQQPRPQLLILIQQSRPPERIARELRFPRETHCLGSKSPSV